MTKVYMFTYQTMLEDLYLNGIGELEIDSIANSVVAELRLSKVIMIEDCYIIGAIMAWMLQERFKINSYEQRLE